MPEKKPLPRISNAEIKAGVFLTFCLALFIGMLFVLGKFGRIWHARQRVDVVFAQANALHRDAPIRYNGMDAGHVKQVRITRVDDALLARMPVLTRRTLEDLPLSIEEREAYGSAPDESLDQSLREKIKGRTVVVLTLELMSEQDLCRYRVDDEFRIVSSVLGESSLEIHTGSGQVISPTYDKVFLGTGGDMYSDLGSSIAEVKDILASMAEMVGGDTGRRNIQDQLDNFEKFTGRLETASDSIGNKLPTLWDNVDSRIDSTRTTANELEEKIAKMKPKFDEALTQAQKAIADMRKNAAEAVQEMQDNIGTRRKDTNDALAEWRKVAAEYRESIPEQVKNARDWSDRFSPTVDKIDLTLTRADDQLNKGLDSTRAALGGYIATASNLEETMYRFKTWPWSYANRPDEEQGRAQDAIYHRDLARRQYLELRAELQQVRQTLQADSSTDRTRVSRIDDILREQDAFFGVGRTSAPDEETPKGKKKK